MTPFRRLWLAQTVSVLGDSLALFAVQVAIVFRMHGSASDMASVFIASLGPSIVLGPVAGMFADRWDPRRTMIASDVARGLLVLLLACAVTLPQICAISFAVSCFSNFFAPARAITLPLLVPPDHLLAANARMQQSMQVVRIASPAVASALVAAFGERICYAADSRRSSPRRCCWRLCATQGQQIALLHAPCSASWAPDSCFCAPIFASRSWCSP